MKPTKIRVNFGVTKNLGNFESLRIDYTVEAELEGEETAGEALNRLRGTLSKKLVGDLNDADGGRDWLKKKIPAPGQFE